MSDRDSGILTREELMELGECPFSTIEEFARQKKP